MIKLNDRTCVFSKTKHQRKDLYRFVKYEGKLVLDEHHLLPGRGYYICKDPQILEKIIAKQFLQKRFQVDDITDFLSQLKQS